MAINESPIRSRTKVYSDVDLAFRTNPNTGDLVRRYDAAAIKQAVTNIIRTRPGEKPFKPLFGCNITPYLFELATPHTLASIRTAVRIALENYEPRIEITKIEAIDDTDRNAVRINIDYRIKSPEAPLDSVTVVVERLR